MNRTSHIQARLVQYFDSIASRWDKWQARNQYYHKTIEQLLQFLITPNFSVLELGCATGDLINAVHPSFGVGVDISPAMVQLAQQKYPHHLFYAMDAEELLLNRKFDYIVMSDLVGVYIQTKALSIYYGINSVMA